MIWSFTDTMGKQFIQLFVQIILARLLLPEDFGLIGIVMVFIGLSHVFVESGFTKGLIRDPEADQKDFSTVFYINLGVSILLYLGLYAGAGVISDFFDQPKLVAITRVLGLVLIINAFGLIQRTILIKEVNFKVQTQISFLSSVIAGGIAIFMAYRGFGVWALVIKMMLTQLLQAVMLSYYNRWLPSLIFSGSSFKRLFNFGWKLLAASLVASLYKEINYIIIGRLSSAADLGFYTKARSFKDTAANSITKSVKLVSFPVLSSIQNDPVYFKKGYKKIITNSAYISFPVMLGLAAITPQLFPLLLGENWNQAIGYFQILALAGLVQPINAINQNIVQVKGRSDLFLRLEIIKKVIGVLLLMTALLLGLGVVGLLWATVISSYIGLYISTWYSKDLAGYSFFEQIKDLRKIIFITLIMGGAVHLAGMLIDLSNLPVVLIQIGVGVTVYTSLSFLWKLDEFYTIFNGLIKVKKKALRSET